MNNEDTKKYSNTEWKQITKIAFKIMEAWQRLNEEEKYCGNFNPIKYHEKTEVASKEAFKLAEKFHVLVENDNEPWRDKLARVTKEQLKYGSDRIGGY